MTIKKVRGATLQELVVAMIILGVISAIAIPELYPLINKAKTKEAQLQLRHLSNMQKQYSYMNSSFSNSLDAIDFISPKTVKNGGRSNYQYEIIEASSSSYTARATAIVDFDGDGVFNVWEITEEENVKEVVKD